MKKMILAFALLCLSWFQTTEAFDIMVEGKAAWFHPTDKKFRRIYDNGGLYGGEITVPFCNGLALFGSVDYFSRKGHSINRCNLAVDGSKHRDRTRIRIIPVALGVKYFYSLPCFCEFLNMDLYVGAGVQWNCLKIRDHSNFVKKHTSKCSVGGIYKIGSIIRLSCDWFLDLFVNYSDNCAHFHRSKHRNIKRSNADLSAWIIGAGIGYNFNFDSFCCY
jgi:hypothetical protein